MLMEMEFEKMGLSLKMLSVVELSIFNGGWRYGSGSHTTGQTRDLACISVPHVFTKWMKLSCFKEGVGEEK